MKKKCRKALLAILAAAVCLTACGGKEEAAKTEESRIQEETAEESGPGGTEEAGGPEENGGAGEAGSAEQVNGEAGKEETTDTGASEPRGLFEAFEAVDLDGNTVNQEIFAGYDLTMINIWATFCGPCISEMPELGELFAEYEEKGVQIIGVCIDVVGTDGSIIDGQVEEAKRIVEETGASYLHMIPEGKLAQVLLPQIQAVPTTIFVDQDGKQVGMGVMGARDKASWSDMIDELLQQ